MLRSIIAIGFLFVVVYCQSCQNEFDTFHDCVKKSAEDQHKAMKEQREEREKKMKDQVRQCFSSNGCKEPNFDNAKEGEKDSHKGKGSGDFEKRHQCSKEMSEKAKADIEKCVKQTQPDFHFPPAQDHKGSEGGEQHGDGGGHFGRIDKAVNDSCPEASRQGVKSCMRDAWQKQSGGNDMRKQFEESFNKTCQARDTCFKAISSKCQTQYNETKKTICDCAQKLDKTQMEQDYKTCAGTTGSTSPPDNDGQGRFGYRGGSPVDAFIKRMCSTGNICQQGFHKGPWGGNHHFGGNLGRNGPRGPRGPGGHGHGSPN